MKNNNHTTADPRHGVFYLNAFVMLFAMTFVPYTTIVEIHRSAETWRVLTERTSSRAPVRMGFAAQMMVPVSGGFTVGQAGVLTVAGWAPGWPRQSMTAPLARSGREACRFLRRGASRAVEHLRSIGVELQMVSTHAAVHIGGGDFMAMHPMFGNKPIEEIEADLLPSAKTALDEPVWWAEATMAAKAAEA